MIVAILVALVVGLVVGMLSGMLGIGGGTILVPVFKLGFGMPPLVCTATSLFTIIPTSISGAFAHFRARTCIVPLGVAAGLGGAVMSPVGVWLASISPDWGTMIAAAAVVLYSSVTMFKKAIGMKSRPANQPANRPADVSRETIGTEITIEENALLHNKNQAHVSRETCEADDPSAAPAPALPKVNGRMLAIGAGIGLGAGLLSGYVGVGGGFIMVPLFMQLLSTPMKLTSGTSLIAVMILAVPGVISQAMLGNVDWMRGIVVSCGSIPGAIIGSHLLNRIPERTLRFIFAGFLLVAAALLVVDQLHII